MNQFNYASPSTSADAAKAFKAASDPKFVAGGQSLLPTIRLGLADPSDLIDLHSIAELADSPSAVLAESSGFQQGRRPLGRRRHPQDRRA